MESLRRLSFFLPDSPRDLTNGFTGRMRWMLEDIPIIADDDGPDTVAILAHGAGSHMEQKTMEWLAQIVRDAGARVVRFNFLYRAQGRGMPDRMPVLIDTYQRVIGSVSETLKPKKLVIGGHSMGGRAASMLEAQSPTANGLLLFGYPLHPAGQPEKLRDAHLASIQAPTLQLNGTEDALCTKEIMERVAPKTAKWQLHWIQGADHSYSVRKSSGRTKSEVAEEMRAATAAWLQELP
jgi:predicted alpha/beta-hydrolase family hydrolase